MAYDTTIFTKQPMLLIFGPGIDFQVGQEMGGVDIFLDFSKSLFTGFSIVHDTNILNEHPFLAILRLGTNFWAQQEVGGKSQPFFQFLKSSLHGLSNSI